MRRSKSTKKAPSPTNIAARLEKNKKKTERFRRAKQLEQKNQKTSQERQGRKSDAYSVSTVKAKDRNWRDLKKRKP